MKTIVKKWGNSLAVRIPTSYAKDTYIQDGSIIIIEKKNNTITLKPQKNKLSEYLEKINKNNIHKEIDSNNPVGYEIW
jgi:antitoxin MazE